MSNTRRKVQKMCRTISVGTEQFLSLEASVVDDSDEEDEDSEEDYFIEDEEPVATNWSISHHLLRLEQTRAESERLFFTEDCCLWRVAVKPGYEETATFILMGGIIRSPSREWGIKSIIGWVVVEAPNGTNVKELCEGVPNVRSHNISMVEHEEVYKGDLAFVKGYSHVGADLLVVPCLKPPAPGATAGKKCKQSKEKDWAKRNRPTRPDPLQATP
ncbi:hypothetical protein DXG01_015217 [Tephrocybe rancida]|nr:hypothetical protein DXG01_015217 [Tephrocybe rancida]